MRPKCCFAVLTSRFAILAARRVGDDTGAPPGPAFPIRERYACSRSPSRPETTTAAPSSRQPRADLGADPAAAAGDDRDLAVERALHARRLGTAAGDSGQRFLRPAGSSTDCPRARVDDASEQSREHAARPQPRRRRSRPSGGEPLDDTQSTAAGSRPGAGGTAARHRPLRVTPASTLRTTGTRGSVTRRGELEREPGAGRRHERAMEGRAHREHDAHLPAPLGGERDGALDGPIGGRR